MSSESENPTERPEPEVGVFPLSAPARRAVARRQPAPASQVEAQLRARIAELEAQLTEAARCLQAAENRSADRLALRAALDLSEHRLAVTTASRSWRFTRLLRSFMARVRRPLGD
jgi:hypothetical protein